MTIQMKAIEEYFQVLLIIMLYKLVLTFKLVDETLACDQDFHVARVKSDETRDRSRQTKVELLVVLGMSTKAMVQKGDIPSPVSLSR